MDGLDEFIAVPLAEMGAAAATAESTFVPSPLAAP